MRTVNILNGPDLVRGVIAGLGPIGYELAIRPLMES
jgi:3-dehydroquinate dehydratase